MPSGYNELQINKPLCLFYNQPSVMRQASTRWRHTQCIFNLVTSWKQVMSMIHQVLAYGHFAL